VRPAEDREFAQAAAVLLDLPTSITEADIVNSTAMWVRATASPVKPAWPLCTRSPPPRASCSNPIYSGKGFAGLLDYCQRGIVPHRTE